jgi:hypothetical protein
VAAAGAASALLFAVTGTVGAGGADGGGAGGGSIGGTGGAWPSTVAVRPAVSNPAPNHFRMRMLQPSPAGRLELPLDIFVVRAKGPCFEKRQEARIVGRK